MAGLLNDLSEKSKTPIPGKQVRDIDDYYPDSEATPPYAEKDTGSNYRLDVTQVPTTRVDMSVTFMWEHGDDLQGDAAAHPGMANYRKDINKAWGKEDKYKDKYLDTFKKISDELDRWEAI